RSARPSPTRVARRARGPDPPVARRPPPGGRDGGRSARRAGRTDARPRSRPGLRVSRWRRSCRRRAGAPSARARLLAARTAALDRDYGDPLEESVAEAPGLDPLHVPERQVDEAPLVRIERTQDRLLAARLH